MNTSDWLEIGIYAVVLVLLTPPLGSYMAKVFSGERHFLSPFLGWLERLTYRICGVVPHQEMDWKAYARSLLVLNGLGLLVVVLLQRVQSALPLNPQNLENVPWPLALNTAVSFVTNTNWQAYAGETTMSSLTQMVGLTVQNFLSAATGISVFLALARGIMRRGTRHLGNFWVDMTRSVVYLFLPLSMLLAVALVSQGVVQTFVPAVDVKTVEGASQLLPMGPVASQVAIKQLGTNGGGFFGVNSAHPFENPTPLSNWLEMLAILLIPSALVYAYGLMVKSKRQGIVLLCAMYLLWFAGLAAALYGEFSMNSIYGVGGLLEGKEVRFGVVNSVLWSMVTTAASNGSINAMLSSLSPLAGGVALLNMMLGEVVFGGVGSGLYGMLLFVFLTVFISGLMVGRTPEYLGKKIETREIGFVILAILLPSAMILLGSGVACVLPVGLSSILNKGPHGLSEMLYAFTSAAQNNGSAFAGLNANTVFYNLTLAIAMLVGRFGVILPVLAIAGSLASKNPVECSEGTFATDTTLFMGLLIAVIVIVGALTFFPALSLGPMVEQLLMQAGTSF